MYDLFLNEHWIFLHIHTQFGGDSLRNLQDGRGWQENATFAISASAAGTVPIDAIGNRDKRFFVEGTDGRLDQYWVPLKSGQNPRNNLNALQMQVVPISGRFIAGTPSGIYWHGVYRVFAREDIGRLVQYYFDTAWHWQVITTDGFSESIN